MPLLPTLGGEAPLLQGGIVSVQRLFPIQGRNSRGTGHPQPGSGTVPTPSLALQALNTAAGPAPRLVEKTLLLQ